MGVAGKGFVLMDSSSEDGSPSMRVYERNSATWYDYSEVVRVGNLKFYLDYGDTNIFGIAMGNSYSYVKVDATNGVRVSANIEASRISGSTIIGGSIKTAESGMRVEISELGIATYVTDQTGKYNSAGKWGAGTKYGTGVRAWIANPEKNVPFYCSTDSLYGDFHYVNRASNPVGVAEIGDTVVVDGKLKVCTTAGTPGTWTIVGSQS